VAEYTDGSGTVLALTRHLRMSKDKYYELMDNHPPFKEQVLRVRASADDRVEDSFFDRATGFEYRETSTRNYVDKDGTRREDVTVSERVLVPDAGASLNWLKNRRPDKWREKTTIEINRGAGWGEMLGGMQGVIDAE
jgi:hypothetical protein